MLPFRERLARLRHRRPWAALLAAVVVMGICTAVVVRYAVATAVLAVQPAPYSLRAPIKGAGECGNAADHHRAGDDLARADAIAIAAVLRHGRGNAGRRQRRGSDRTDDKPGPCAGGQPVGLGGHQMNPRLAPRA